MVGRVDTMQTTFIAISVALGSLVGAFVGRVVQDVAHIFIAQGVWVILTAFYFVLVPSIRKLPKFNDIAREEEDAGDVFTDA